MYTLYRSPAVFYECLITIVITLLCTTATPPKISVLPPVYRHYCIQYTSNENQSSQSVNCQIQHTEEARKMLVFTQKSLLDCLTTKKFQDFPGLFSNFRTFQDWCEPCSYNIANFQHLLLFLNVCEQTCHISLVCISQKVEIVLMCNLRHIIFI